MLQTSAIDKLSFPIPAESNSSVLQEISSTYYQLTPNEVRDRCFAAKETLGDSVFILAHHYQRDETFQFQDASGDSLNLAQVAKKQSAQYILFCGVHFMAESADILTSDDQAVILPNLTAGCSMADMADVDMVEDCWDELIEACGENKFIPITYINSSASLKAFCGKNGGIVCTSSNSETVLQWALKKGKSVLFFPDQHLGRNTANKLGVPKENIRLWDRQNDGGLTAEDLKNTKVLLWNGYCSVHTRFSVDQIKAIRSRRPEVKVIVHPECSEEVVNAADFDGSTNKIIQIIENAESGSSWAVGTEINLVHRLHQKLYPREGKHIECLNPHVCPCSTMYCTDPVNVLWVLENLIEGRVVNQIKVPPETARWAKVALDRMLKLS